MSNSEDMFMGELEFLRHIVRETARMSYPGRFGGKLRGGAKEATQEQFENVYPSKLQAQIAHYDVWHKKRINQLSHVIKKRNYRQDENDTSFALSAKLVNTFMHQLMKYEQFRYLYKHIHLPLDRTVFQRLCRAENGHNELHCLRKLVEPFTEHAYRFDANTYAQIQERLWGVVNYFNDNVLTENQICSRIDLNCLLW